MDGRGFKKLSQIRLIKNLSNVIRRFIDLERNVNIGLKSITIIDVLAIAVNRSFKFTSRFWQCL
jgi:hypothetical protein